MSESDDVTIRRGGENIFADLGYADADTHKLKAELVTHLSGLMASRNLTQSQVAQQTGISQPDVSRILKGRFRDVSVERIMRMLVRLGCEIDIVVRSAGEQTPSPAIHFCATPFQRV
jgi:predicted XRE-type DNA-binding protein